MYELKILNVDHVEYKLISMEINDGEILIYKKNMEIYPINKYPSDNEIDLFIKENKQLTFLNDIISNDSMQMGDNHIIFHINENSDNLFYIPLTQDEIKQFKDEFKKLKMYNSMDELD